MKENGSNDKVTLRDVYKYLQDFREEVRDTYVTKDEFNPVKAVAYGMVGVVLVGVIGAILANVVKTTP